MSSAISDPFIVTPLFRPPANSLILTSSQDKINTIINNALPSITDELARYNQLGYSLEQQLQSMISISNEASVSQCIARGLPLFIQNTLLNWRNQVQSSNLASLNQTRQNAQQHNSPPDLSEFAVELTLFAAIMSGAYASLSPSDFELATTLLTLLIGDAGTIQKLNPSDNPVDFDVGSVFLDILGGISLSVGFQKDIREGRNPLNPEISMEDSAEVHATVKQKDSFSTSLLDPSPVPVCNYECQAVSTVQQAIRQLVSVLMINFQPGSPPRTANAKLIELNMYREYTSFLGDSDGVHKLGFGNGLAFHLPPGLLSSPEHIRSAPENIPSVVDVVGILYRFNVLELINNANPPPGVNTSLGYHDIRVPGVVATNFSITEVNTLLFLNEQNQNENYDPYNLSEPLNITIPFPINYTMPSSYEEIVCGFWNTSYSGWSVEGCSVAEINLSSGYLICSCNHASDFSVWNAFLADLGGGPEGVIATISIVVVSVLLPGLLVVWLLLFLWGRNKDLEDAHAVHLGALILLTRNKLRVSQQQRRVFQVLKENAQRRSQQKNQVEENTEIPVATRISITQTDSHTQGSIHTLKACCLSNSTAFGRFVRAMYYEHSFFGIFTRFDPFFSRTQRATVVIAVLAGNLFAASFFFDFKVASDLSPGVLVASIIVASLVVAIPVKMIVRYMFRATEQELGSPMHRVAQIYRISEVNGDLLPAYANSAERADVQMLFAFKDFYAAQSNVIALRRLIRYKENQLKPKKPCYRDCSLMNSTITQEEKEGRYVANRFGLSVDENGDFSMEDLLIAVQKAEARAKEFLEQLKRASLKSKEEWDKLPKAPNLRVETLRKQQSTIMKLTSLLYEEYEERPRTRQKYFRSRFLYFSWFLVILYLCGTLAYSSRWVLVRTSYKQNLYPNATITELQADANGIIVAWLISAIVGVVTGLFIAEPILYLLRYGIFTALLNTFGNGTAKMFQKDNTKVHVTGFDNYLSKPVYAKEFKVESNHTDQKPDLVPSSGEGKSDSTHLNSKKLTLLQKFKNNARDTTETSDVGLALEIFADFVESIG